MTTLSPSRESVSTRRSRSGVHFPPALIPWSAVSSAIMARRSETSGPNIFCCRERGPHMTPWPSVRMVRISSVQLRQVNLRTK